MLAETTYRLLFMSIPNKHPHYSILLFTLRCTEEGSEVSMDSHGTLAEETTIGARFLHNLE